MNEINLKIISVQKEKIELLEGIITNNKITIEELKAINKINDSLIKIYKR